jgi:hypothetical protein
MNTDKHRDFKEQIIVYISSGDIIGWIPAEIVKGL